MEETLIRVNDRLLKTVVNTPIAPPRYKNHGSLAAAGLENGFSRLLSVIIVINSNPAMCIITVAEYTPYCSVSPPLKATITEIKIPVSSENK